MKRYLSLFLAIVMLFGLMGTAFAEGNTPTFVVSEETAAPGDEVRVTISIQNNTEVASIQLEPQYDHDVLEWTDVEQGDYTGTWNPRVDKGFVNWFGINGHNVSNDGVFATLVFKVSENAAAGDYAVTVTYDEDNVYDEDEENVYFAIQDGKVTVTAPETAYYLVGSMNEWSVDEAYKFVPNPANSDEYMLSITLAEGDEFKAVAATGTTPTAWYPDGLDNNYIVGANQAGDVTVYFRPDGRGGDGWHYGYLYIAPRGPEFKTQKLLLAAKIGVRFYVYLPEIDGYEYEGVEFTIEGKGGENSWVPFNSDLPTNIQGWYGFTYYVNTIQMADKITATLKYYVNDEEKTLVKEYHVMDYFEAFDVDYENNPTPYDEVEGLVDMVKATADLGHYVQAYLDEARSEWSVPTDHADMEKYYTTYEDDDLADANEAVADHALKVEGSCSDIKSLGYALYMDSAMMIRVTIVPNSGFTGTFNATVDGETVEVRKISRVKYAVEIPNVMAHQLSTKHTIVIGTDDGGSYTLTGSGLSFVKMMLDAYEGNETAVNAAVAVYRYSKFADDLKEGASEAKQN